MKPISSDVTPQNIRGISAATAVLQPLKQVRHIEEKYLTPGLESVLWHVNPSSNFTDTFKTSTRKKKKTSRKKKKHWVDSADSL